MNIKVKINDSTYDVEVGDLHSQPVIAIVDGERFEVWLPELKAFDPTPAMINTVPAQIAAKAVPKLSENGHSVVAPLPGEVVSISVQQGIEVALGEELCVIEAMKMKNTIRAPHAGKIASVHITVGQKVKQRELLVEFA